MNSLIKFGHLATRLSSKQCVYLTCVREAHWNKDWLPGPYPKTEEERKKAAEKYGMHPDEYEPYPDDGFGHGDYPKLPFKGAALKDPYYPYDNIVYKRNFGEPIHIDWDAIGEDRYTAGGKLPHSPAVIISVCFGMLFLWAAIFFYTYDIKFVLPASEKQRPKEGVIHYTFEPVN